MQLDLNPSEFILLTAMAEQFLLSGGSATLSAKPFSNEVCERLLTILHRAGARGGLCALQSGAFRATQKPEAIERAIESLHRDFVYHEMKGKA